jgi:hypothetical protein
VTARTVADVRRDLDLDRMLDDALQHPRCEMRTRLGGAECGAPADGYRFASPCRHGVFACITCRDHWEQLRAKVEHDTGRQVRATCSSCGAPVIDIIWRSL